MPRPRVRAPWVPSLAGRGQGGGAAECPGSCDGSSAELGPGREQAGGRDAGLEITEKVGELGLALCERRAGQVVLAQTCQLAADALDVRLRSIGEFSPDR